MDKKRSFDNDHEDRHPRKGPKIVRSLKGFIFFVTLQFNSWVQNSEMLIALRASFGRQLLMIKPLVPNKKSGPEPFLDCFWPLSISFRTNNFFQHIIPTIKTAAASGTTKIVTFFSGAAVTMTF